MTTKSNLHSHCTYCDGKSTIEEMVLAAIDAGLQSIGFSSHCPTGYSFDECQVTDVEGYFAELEQMRLKYQDRIDIYKGMELESRINGEVRPAIDSRCDYSIGALHYFRTPDGFHPVDYIPKEWLAAKASVGSVQKLLEGYFEEFLSFAQDSSFDIIAHIDLYTKFNEKDHLFDENEPWYQNMALSYVDKFAATGKIFEVNTGAMSRGYRSIPYPAQFILRRLLALNAPIILSSDSHKADTICFGFDKAEKMLKDIGFTSQMRLTREGFVSVPL